MAVAFGFLRGSGRRGGTPAFACQTSITGRGTARNIGEAGAVAGHPHLPVRPASLVVEPRGTSVSPHGLGYFFTALRRQGLIADELVLQLTTFLRSLDLFLELIVLTPSTLTANQVRHGGKQGTH